MIAFDCQSVALMRAVVTVVLTLVGLRRRRQHPDLTRVERVFFPAEIPEPPQDFQRPRRSYALATAPPR
jgi:hypothetical protein